MKVAVTLLIIAMATGEEEMESILLGEVFGQLTAVWCKYGAPLATENFLDVF